MEERSYDGYDDSPPKRMNYGRLLLAGIVIIITAMGLILAVAYPIIESELYIWLLMLLLIPMTCMISCTACAWGRGRLITPVDVKSDERVFEEMRLRASRATQVDIDWYRCPECQEAFDVSNAEPVDDKVYLCPFCNSRLIIG